MTAQKNFGIRKVNFFIAISLKHNFFRKLIQFSPRKRVFGQIREDPQKKA